MADPTSNVTLLPATAADAAALAGLHTESWRSAYRGLVPDDYLARQVAGERLRFWATRMADDTEPRCVLKAMAGGELVGFACVLRDADPDWGPLLDNLHVRPDRKGQGIGRLLFQASREWAAAAAPGAPMHLWVIEGNVGARGFYDRLGGRITARELLELVPGVQVASLRYVWK